MICVIEIRGDELNNSANKVNLKKRKQKIKKLKNKKIICLMP
jgi:hypothetical protein